MYQLLRSTFNFKFKYLRRSFGNQPFKLLDIGAGNNSASKICSVFPACEYHGLDQDKTYNNSEADFKIMKAFYEVDLTKLDFSMIPDSYFDGIWMTHVIEHLPNGDEVVAGLIPKLKAGGFFYIEYPGKKSTTLPSMYGTLNFYDDNSHVRIYSVGELSEVYQPAGCTVIASGTRRNWYYIAAMPLLMLNSLLRKGRLEGMNFWDLLGFAEFLYVRKKR